jgi:uncharacterized protein YecE (DUF72 family)
VSPKKPIEFPRQGTFELLDAAQAFASEDIVERPDAVPGLRLGTSAFTANGWPGTFYPAGMQPRDYLSYYATKFNSVEVDSTFYRTPLASTVNGWYAKTPKDFIFALKVPRVITHEKVLLDCEQEMDEFINVAGLLGEKLGPLVLQFPYFNSEAFESGADFFARLRFFLTRLGGSTVRYAVEIRNKHWLDARFVDLLREHKVALVLQDLSWMPNPRHYFEKFDPITANFTYIRLLGDRKGIEKETKMWDKVIVDRTSELRSWVDVCKRTLARGVPTYVYVNNHYAGHAPATVESFLELWDAPKI